MAPHGRISANDHRRRRWKTTWCLLPHPVKKTVSVWARRIICLVPGPNVSASWPCCAQSVDPNPQARAWLSNPSCMTLGTTWKSSATLTNICLTLLRTHCIAKPISPRPGMTYPAHLCHTSTPKRGTTMAQRGLYQPKIADEHIRQLYQWAKRLEMPMTRLVNALLAHGLTRLEQGVENVSDPPAGAYGRRKTRPEEN